MVLVLTLHVDIICVCCMAKQINLVLVVLDL